MSSFIESTTEGFETDEIIDMVDDLIINCLYEPSNHGFPEGCFEGLNTKNKLRLLELISQCYSYFDEEDCDEMTAKRIEKYMNCLSFKNDPPQHERARKNINRILNYVRQHKDEDYMKAFVNITKIRIGWVLHSSKLRNNLAFGVVGLIGGHKVSTEMIEIINDFLINHPEYWERVLHGQLGIHIHDSEYQYHSIKKTERYLQNRFEENPDDVVYKMLYELFTKFNEHQVDL